MPEGSRYYIVCRPIEDFIGPYFEPDLRSALNGVERYLSQYLGGEADKRFQVMGAPSRSVYMDDKTRRTVDTLSDLVVALAIEDRGVLDWAQKAIEERTDIFVGGGADLPFASASHWCPNEATDPIFGDRSAAEELLGVSSLCSEDGQRLTGQGVNVVIVDEGLDAAALARNYKGGWPVGKRQPGTTPARGTDDGRRSHGMLIAENILKVAPDVRLFDVPVTPSRIADHIPTFLNETDAACRTMRDKIREYRQEGRYPGSWILVNPWGIRDTRTDLAPPQDYAGNPTHAFNELIGKAVSEDIDVVFAAGNCGQFCPDWRCGPDDRGRGRSIHGANSLAEVLTVGAVRVDGMWLGYSSQGPGRLAEDKPDLCAPSQFREDDDADTVNTGTSTACALAAGVVAAVRQRWSGSQVSPKDLIEVLKATARKCESDPPERFGRGILDAAAAHAELAQRWP